MRKLVEVIVRNGVSLILVTLVLGACVQDQNSGGMSSATDANSGGLGASPPMPVAGSSGADAVATAGSSGANAAATAGSSGANAPAAAGAAGTADPVATPSDPPVQPCSKTTACGASACSIEGLPGASVLNNVSCPQACCTASGGCGLSLATTAEPIPTVTECIALAQPGTESTECPAYFDSFAVGGENLLPFERENIADSNFKGCCRPEWMCGFMVSPYGLGCVSVEEMPKFTAVIAFITELKPRTCTPSSR